ncbi:YndM family protein [Lentibacillus halophilus]
MIYLKTLGIKAIAIGITVLSLFGIFYYANLMNLFWISILLTGVTFLVGDLLILRRFGNVTASIVDFPLAFFVLWLLGSLLIEASIPLVSISLIAAFFIACCEPFIHTYIEEKTEEDNEGGAKPSPDTGRMQTEFAEEFEFDKNENRHDHL